MPVIAPEGHRRQGHRSVERRREDASCSPIPSFAVGVQTPGHARVTATTGIGVGGRRTAAISRSSSTRAREVAEERRDRDVAAVDVVPVGLPVGTIREVRFNPATRGRRARSPRTSTSACWTRHRAGVDAGPARSGAPDRRPRRHHTTTDGRRPFRVDVHDDRRRRGRMTRRRGSPRSSS